MQSSLVVPARLAYLRPFTAYLDALAAEAGFDPEEAGSIHLATEEVFVNLVKHGFPDTSDGSFQVDMEIQSAGLSVAFKAKGMPFSPDSIPDYDPEEVRNGYPPQGLGLFLARRAVDRLTFINMGRGGYSIELVKMLHSKRIDRYPDKEVRSQDAAGTAPVPEGGVGQYAIRPLLPEEAIEISRCAYHAYGYSYEDYIYYPDRIVEANRAGHMLSLVAVTPVGEIMGHIALKRTNVSDVIGEMGVLFIKPEYRQGGLGAKLIRAAIEEARARGFSALYGRTVAGHKVSQKITHAVGLRDCAILLGVFPSQVEFKSLAGTIQQKMSGLVQWIGLKPPRHRCIFSTPEFIPQLSRIYERLGLPLAFGTAPVCEPLAGLPESSHLSVLRDMVLGMATIEVHRYGEDLLRQARHQLRMLCLEQMPVIYLHLNAEHPATQGFLPQLQEMGFFFSGVLPDGLAGSDTMILQYLNNLEIDYESICLYTPESIELLSFIKAMDPVRRDLAPLNDHERLIRCSP